MVLDFITIAGTCSSDDNADDDDVCLKCNDVSAGQPLWTIVVACTQSVWGSFRA